MAVSLTAVVLLTACAAGITPIKSLLDDPSRYNGKTVRAAGKVTHAVGALGYGGYQINDGTGTLTVVSKGKGGGSPREGADIGVQGKFRGAGIVGKSVAVLEESKRFTP